MENNGLGKYTTSFGVSLGITSLVSAILVIIKESSEGLLAFMKSVTGHHWVTHGLFALIVFVVLGYVLALPNKGQGIKLTENSLLTVIVGGIVIGGLIIGGFYFLELLGV
jgi:hypothetical protein